MPRPMRWTILAALMFALSACNLGFDPAEFGPLPVDEDAGDNNSGTNNSNNVEVDGGFFNDAGEFCADRDDDGFVNNPNCGPKDQIDCDDSRQFVNPGAVEICDGLDNDCDDSIDEGDDGFTLARSCYTGATAELNVANTACQEGRVFCVDGVFPPNPIPAEQCEGQQLPSFIGELEGPSLCDGIDNDCDGFIDPNCACPAEGAVEPCWTGAAEKRGVGTCADGERRCFRNDDNNLVWGACQGETPEAEELCSNPGEDNDCDGVDDNIQGLGDACETELPGRCLAGTRACSDANEDLCVSDLPPLDEETCNGVDDNCNGETDEGVLNACGSCGELPGAPGEACGPCNDGEYACNPDGEMECVGARELNACNGCQDLDFEPGENCGECGAYVCDSLDAVRCADTGPNDCGGCGPIIGGELLGNRCGNCGTWVCDGSNNVTCEDPGFNSCGGCQALAGEPGQACGPCNDGVYDCEGASTVVCLGSTALNACGGCNRLNNSPGDPCGTCGTQRCDPDNAGFLFCDDPGANDCGGCGPLNAPIGEACGTCGEQACVDGNTECRDFGNNVCGGCADLPGDPSEDTNGNGQLDPGEDFDGDGQLDEAEPCGECGVFVCDGTENAVCDDPGLNACGGCGDLAGRPSEDRNGNGLLDPGEDYDGDGFLTEAEMCGDCGEWRCSLNRSSVICADPGRNACGGCGELQGAPLGTSCGTCGEYVCSVDQTSTVCDDPGYNSCLGCGELTNSPGSACSGCAYFQCGPQNQLLCDDRDCPGGLTAARLWNLLVTTRDCTTNADCGTGYQCRDIDQPNGTPDGNDTCVPVFEVEINDDFVLFPNWSWSDSTQYFAGAILLAADKIDGWLKDTIESNTGWTYSFENIVIGTERTTILHEEREFCSSAADCDAANPLCQNESCTSACVVDADCPEGACNDGFCLRYGLEEIVDNNVPTPDMVKLRFFLAHGTYRDIRITFVSRTTGTIYAMPEVTDYGTMSPYLEVPPDYYAVTFEDAQGNPLFTFNGSVGYEFRGGEVRTFMLHGRYGVTTVWLTNVSDRDHTVSSL